MAALTNYLENKLIDQLLRGEAFTFPSTLYIGLLTAAPTDSTPGTEVSGGGYARVGVACSLANWAGTQGAGTTAASSGTSGTTTNNNAVIFSTATTDWGSLSHFGWYDAATGGNLWMYAPLDTARQVLSGDPAQFPAGKISFQIDN